MQVGPRVLADRVAHRRALLARAGEELHGEDVGVAVDHAPDERRARLRHDERARPGAGHEVGREPRVGRDPEHDGERQPGADRAEGRDRRDREDRDVEQRVDDDDRHLAHRRPDLHHAVGEPPREVGLEVGERVAQRVEVRPPAHHVGALGHDELVGERLVQPVHERARHQDEGGRRRERRAVLGQHPVGGGVPEDVEEPAHQEVERGLDAARHQRHDEEHDERGQDRPEVEAREARHGVRGHARVVEGRERVDAALEPVEEHGSSGLMWW